MPKIFHGLELCSGPGGLSEGFTNVKYHNYKFFISVANDTDENVAKTYVHNHPNTEFILGSLVSENIKKTYDYIKTKIILK